MNNRKKRFLAFVIVVIMVLSIMPHNIDQIYAYEDTSAEENDNNHNADIRDDVEADLATPNTPEEKIEESTETENEKEEQQATCTDKKKNKSENETDSSDSDDLNSNKNENDEMSGTGTFVKIYSDVDTTALDFSGCELLIVPKDENIFTEDTQIISELNGVYLTHFESEEETRSAYTYYYDKSEIIEVNEVLSGCDNESESASLADSISDKEPQESTQNTVDELSVKGNSAYVALIDTGAANDNVIEETSVIGDSASDDNGHGTRMAALIAAVNPNVRILSIKALDEHSNGSVSDIYEAIEYAISKNVSIINLSISSLVSSDSEIIQRAIEDAVSQGIYVVVAAGNRGASARYYTPGNISAAITIGACDKDGNRISISNYGTCLDYYVSADTTSIGAAIFTGYLSVYGLENIESIDGIFTREAVETDEKNPGALIDDSSKNPLVFSATKDSDNESIEDKEEHTKEIPVKGAMEGTISITNGANGSNYLTATKLSTGNYKYTIDTNQGTFYVYCIDPSMINPNNEANYTFTQKAVEYSSIGYNRELTTVLWYGLHYSKTGIQSYNDSIKSVGYYSEENDLYNQTHYTAAYAAGGDGYSASSFHAKETYDKMMSWMNSADSNKDGKFYVANDGKEGDSGSDAEKKFYSGKGYRVYFDYEGTDATDLNFAFASESNENEDAGCNVKIKTTDTAANSTYGSGQITEWIHLIPKYTKPSDDVWANISTAIPVPSKGKIYVDENGDGKVDKTYTSGNAIIWGNSKFKIWINDKSSKNLYSTGSCKNSTIFVQTWVATAASKKTQRLAYLYIPQTTSMLNFYWGGYVPKERYVAIQKIDANNGKPVNGVTFVLAHNGDKDKYASNYDASAQIKIGNDTIKGYASAVTRTLKVGKTEYKGVALFKFIDLPEDAEYSFRFLEASAPEPYRNIEGNLSKSKNDFKSIKPDGTKIFVLSTKGNNNTNRDEAVKNALNYKVANFKPTYLNLLKNSADVSVTNGNPNYSLAGATYRIYKSKTDAESNNSPIHEFVVKEDGTSDFWQIPDSCMSKDNNGVYKNTTFYYKEIKSGRNYKLNTTIGSIDVTAANQKASPALIKVSDEPVLDDVTCKIIKKDKLSGLSLSESNSTLEGTSFIIKYYIEDISSGLKKSDLENKTPAKTFNICTKWDENTKAYIATLQEKLPLGYVTIEETGASKNYKTEDYKSVINSAGKEYDITGAEAFVLKSSGTADEGYSSGAAYWVENDGKAANNIPMNLQAEIAFANPPVRADIHILKMDRNGKALEGFKFKVTNVTSGEFHYIYTDAKGEYHSAASQNPRTAETINSADISDYSKDNSYPIWFENTEDEKQKIPCSNDYGALSPGDYEIREVRGGLNKSGYQLEPLIRFTVDEKTDGKDIGITYNGEDTVVDAPPIGFGTTAVCVETGSDLAPANASIKISDICSFTSLRADTEYTVVGTLMMRNTETKEVSEYKDSEGKIRRTIKTFKTDKKWKGTIYSMDCEQEVIFENVDTTMLSGQDLVVYEVLYLGNVSEEDLNKEKIEYQQYEDGETEVTFPIRHEDSEDSNQTIHIPSISTTAQTQSGKEAYANELIKINDVVRYENLVPGTYTLKGKLMNKLTGEEIYLGDKGIEAEVTFKVEQEGSQKNTRIVKKGLVDMSFEADLSSFFANGSELKKIDVVVFEELFRGEEIKEENKIAEHQDLEDEGQTVTVKRREEKTTVTTTEVTTETVTEGTTRATTEVTTQATTEQPNTKVFSETKTPENKPKTGDNTSIVLAILTSLVSLAAAVIIFGRKRRNSKRNIE